MCGCHGETQFEKVDRKRGDAICSVGFFLSKVKVKQEKYSSLGSDLSSHLVSFAMVLKREDAFLNCKYNHPRDHWRGKITSFQNLLLLRQPCSSSLFSSPK